MAYKIVSQAKAWWPIRFNGVTEDGEIVVNEIRGRFKILDEDEHIQLQLDMSTATNGVATDQPDVKISDLIAPYVLRILEDWEGVTEDDGSESGRSLPFNEDNLKRMLRVPNFSSGLATAHAEVRAASPERRKGN